MTSTRTEHSRNFSPLGAVGLCLSSLCFSAGNQPRADEPPVPEAAAQLDPLQLAEISPEGRSLILEELLASSPYRQESSIAWHERNGYYSIHGTRPGTAALEGVAVVRYNGTEPVDINPKDIRVLAVASRGLQNSTVEGHGHLRDGVAIAEVPKPALEVPVIPHGGRGASLLHGCSEIVWVAPYKANPAGDKLRLAPGDTLSLRITIEHADPYTSTEALMGSREVVVAIGDEVVLINADSQLHDLRNERASITLGTWKPEEKYLCEDFFCRAAPSLFLSLHERQTNIRLPEIAVKRGDAVEIRFWYSWARDSDATARVTMNEFFGNPGSAKSDYRMEFLKSPSVETPGKWEEFRHIHRVGLLSTPNHFGVSLAISREGDLPIGDLYISDLSIRVINVRNESDNP